MIQERVKIIGWKKNIPIIYLKEFEKQTIETTNLLWDEVEVLANEKPFYLITDVSNSAPPSAEVRRLVVERYTQIVDNLICLYPYVGKKTLLRIASKFIIRAAQAKKVEFIRDIQEGLDKIKSDQQKLDVSKIE
jgi:hypothetical protein